MVDQESALITVAQLENMPVDFSNVKTPELCEIWTWQGDTSILPFKFESVLNSAATEPDFIGFGKQAFQH